MHHALQVSRTDNPHPPRPIDAARVYVLVRNVLSALGLLIIVSIAVPDARDFVLRNLLWTPWKKEFGHWPTPQTPRAEPWLALGIGEAHKGWRGTGPDSETRESGPLVETGTTGLQPAALQKREQLAVTTFIAKRYRVADDVVARFVALAHRVGVEQAVDPMLVLAVMAIESRYNPIAESVMGARGLMQIIPKYHLDKLSDHGGPDALLDPDVNIQVGARILREYIGRFRDTELALQMYAGALDEPTLRYARKVLAERSRLNQVLLRTRREA